MPFQVIAYSVNIAVTGTNGKTTTTSLIAHILKAGGINALAVGNIGNAVCDAVATGQMPDGLFFTAVLFGFASGVFDRRT